MKFNKEELLEKFKLILYRAEEYSEQENIIKS